MSETATLLIGGLLALNFVIVPGFGFLAARRRDLDSGDASMGRAEPLGESVRFVGRPEPAQSPRRLFERALPAVSQERSSEMEQRMSVGTRAPEDAGAEAIYRAAFRMTAVADLYGPDRAVEWAQSLLDDPDLLRAFARSGPARETALEEAAPAHVRFTTSARRRA